MAVLTIDGQCSLRAKEGRKIHISSHPGWKDQRITNTKDFDMNHVGIA